MELFRLFGSIFIEDNAANQSLDRTDKKSHTLMGTVGKLAGVIAGAFAVDKIIEFGKSSIEAAANAQAMDAQFTQVFGKIGDSAQKTIDGLGKKFGMVPNRIKPAMTQMTSMFKGLGMDTETAMGTAKDAVTVVADSAAFYDKSFEDANSALNSFIKGNYEGGESIGLFANETQLASWASKELGVDWKKLDEKGKQVARLEFAKSMQEAAGATGQAARESNSYQNQLGNLKQTWTDIKAKLAAPILQPVINGLKMMAEWLGKIDVGEIITGFKKFGSYMVDILKPTFDDVKNAVQILWDKFTDTGAIETAKGLLDGLKQALGFIREHAELVTAAIAGVVGGLIAFQVITTISTAVATFTKVMQLFRAGQYAAMLAQLGLNTAMLANPFTWIAVGIGALIAVVVLLWKNWDSVSKWLSASWQWIKGVATTVFQGIGTFLTRVWNGIKSMSTTVWNGIKSFLNSVWNGVKTVAMAVFNALKNYFTFVFNFYKTIITTVWNVVKSFLSTIWKGIKSVATTLFNALKTYFTTVFNAYKTIITTVWNGIKTFLVNAWNGIKSTATTVWNGVKSSISTAMNGIKSTVTSIWNGLKSTTSSVWNGIKTAITTPINAAKTAVSTAIGKIKGLFSGLGLKLPDIKTPHFKLKNWSINPLDWIKNKPSVGIDWYAKGTNYADGGLSVVGEHGPELLNIPRGSQVKNAGETRGLLDKRGGDINVQIDAKSVDLDEYQLLRVFQRLEVLHG